MLVVFGGWHFVLEARREEQAIDWIDEAMSLGDLLDVCIVVLDGGVEKLECWLNLLGDLGLGDRQDRGQ